LLIKKFVSDIEEKKEADSKSPVDFVESQDQESDHNEDSVDQVTISKDNFRMDMHNYAANINDMPGLHLRFSIKKGKLLVV
jgi:hypothetical protein